MPEFIADVGSKLGPACREIDAEGRLVREAAAQIYR